MDRDVTFHGDPWIRAMLLRVRGSIQLDREPLPSSLMEPLDDPRHISAWRRAWCGSDGPPPPADDAVYRRVRALVQEWASAPWPRPLWGWVLFPTLHLNRPFPESSSAWLPITGDLIAELGACDTLPSPHDVTMIWRRYGPHLLLRAVASLEPKTALHVAQHLDHAPHPVTRAGASADPWAALQYALHVDHAPHPVTWRGVADSPAHRRHYIHAFAMDAIMEACLDGLPVTASMERPWHVVLGIYRNPALASAETRAGASADPWAALQYALHVDHAPHPVTRAGASADPWAALQYALHVDHAPHPVTRAGASADPWAALQYALHVDHAPHPVTWRGVADSPAHRRHYIHAFAMDAIMEACLDGLPVTASMERPWHVVLGIYRNPALASAETRAGASADPWAALQYALHVDHAPHPVTRAGASADPWAALQYALHVDHAPHPVTRAGASADPWAALQYAACLGGPLPDTVPGMSSYARALAQLLQCPVPVWHTMVGQIASVVGRAESEPWGVIAHPQ